MSTNTIRLHRVLRAAPDKIYSAFLDPDAMAKWLPPHGFPGRVHHLDWQESLTLLALLVEAVIPA